VLDTIRRGELAAALEVLDTYGTRSELYPSEWAELAVLNAYAGRHQVALEQSRFLVDPPWVHLAAVVRGEALEPDAVLASVKPANACQAAIVAWAPMTLRRPSAARDLLEAIVAVDPSCRRGSLALAHIYLKEERPGHAIDLLSPLALGGDDPHASFRMMLAQAYRQAGRPEKSFSLMEDVVREGAGKGDPLRLLISLYVRRDHDRAALARWKERAQALPEDPIPTMMVGILLHQRDAFRESEIWLERVAGTFSAPSPLPRLSRHERLQSGRPGGRPYSVGPRRQPLAPRR
jgi:hypothetical protein